MRLLTGLCLAAAILILAAPRPAATHVASVQTLTVRGDADGLKRFVGLQQSRRPSLHTSMSGAEARVDLPSNFTAGEVVALTREALAAGLSYSYERHIQAPRAD